MKRMNPEFQEKVLLKLDSIASAYPEAARKRKITPEFMEKLLMKLGLHPKGLKFKMQPAKYPDLKSPGS
jgi:hypothetical protein